MGLKIGILCAGDDELEPFLPHIKSCRISEKAMLRFYDGQIEGTDVTALYSGVCKVNAAVAAQLLIDTYGCSVIINAGTAGGMDKTLHIFDTVVATEAAYWDVAEDILTEFHPWMSSVFFKSDSLLLDLLKDMEAGGGRAGAIRFGRMVTGESFIADEKRVEINRSFSPLTVDMETAAAAHVCFVNQIPFVAIRTVTDTAEHSGVGTFEENCRQASRVAAEIAMELIARVSRASRQDDDTLLHTGFQP